MPPPPPAQTPTSNHKANIGQRQMYHNPCRLNVCLGIDSNLIHCYRYRASVVARETVRVVVVLLIVPGTKKGDADGSPSACFYPRVKEERITLVLVSIIILCLSIRSRTVNSGVSSPCLPSTRTSERSGKERRDLWL